MLSNQSLMNNVCHSQLNPKASTSGLLVRATGKGQSASTCQGSPRASSGPSFPDSCPKSASSLCHLSPDPRGMRESPHRVLGRSLAAILPWVSPPGQNQAIWRALLSGRHVMYRSKYTMMYRRPKQLEKCFKKKQWNLYPKGFKQSHFLLHQTKYQPAEQQIEKKKNHL